MLLIITIAVFLLIISVVVLVHEAGHFFMAKKFGIKVEEFGFGFPPRIAGFKKGGTIYSINWLPIGGFVKLYGEDEAGGGRIGLLKKITDKNKQEAFIYKPGWQKILVVIAGVAMNFILAFVILAFIFALVGQQVPSGKIVITQVINKSPAHTVGLKTGDYIIKINNIYINNFNQVDSLAKNNLGKKISMLLKTPDNKLIKVSLIPRKTYPWIGIAMGETTVFKKYPWYQAPFVGIGQALTESWLLIGGIGTVFYQFVFHASIPRGIVGPVGIVQLTGELINYGGFLPILNFIPLFSLDLAIVNILPIPALDGGRLLFIIIEMLTRKKISQKTQAYANAVGMAFVLALVVVLTIHDILRIVHGQRILPKP